MSKEEEGETRLRTVGLVCYQREEVFQSLFWNPTGRFRFWDGGERVGGRGGVEERTRTNLLGLAYRMGVGPKGICG